MAALEQAMKEQLEDSKRREEEEKRARQEKERITGEITEAKLHAKLNGLKTEAEFISSLATKVPLSTWKDVEDPKVKQSMGELKDCQDKVDKLKYPDLIVQMAEADITPDNIPGWNDTGLAANQVTNPVQEVSNKLDLKMLNENCIPMRLL